MNNNSIRIDISGGEYQERELLTDAVSTTLAKRGFTNVTGLDCDGEDTQVVGEFKPSTIFASIAALRPDLFDREIIVAPAPSSGPFGDKIYCAVSHGHNAIADRNGNATVEQTLDKAHEVGLPITEVAVRGQNLEAVLRGVRTALTMSPNTYVTASLATHSPFDRNPEHMRYYAPDRDIQEQGNPYWNRSSQKGNGEASTVMSNLRQSIEKDMVNSPSFKQLVADIAHDMYVDSIQVIDSNKISQGISEQIREEVDAKIANGQYHVADNTRTVYDHDDADIADTLPPGAVIDDRRQYVPPQPDPEELTARAKNVELAAQAKLKKTQRRLKIEADK